MSTAWNALQNFHIQLSKLFSFSKEKLFVGRKKWKALQNQNAFKKVICFHNILLCKCSKKYSDLKVILYFVFGYSKRNHLQYPGVAAVHFLIEIF